MEQVFQGDHADPVAGLDEDILIGHRLRSPLFAFTTAPADPGRGAGANCSFGFQDEAQGQGTGLGLSTVYGIVKQNQGYIWVYSEEGQGTTFKIYLPHTEETASPLTSAEAGAEMPDGDETVLLVEDNVQVRELAQTVLEEQGYTVLGAEDGQEALQLAADHTGPIHLLLTDVIMPGMSGKTVTEQLSRTQPDLKILFMSGHSDETIAHHGVLDPDVAFLPKPFSPTVLARKVREVLDA